MSAPFSPWERNSAVDWVYGEQWPHMLPKARRREGHYIIRKVWSRVWCDPVTEHRDASLALLEALPSWRYR